MNFKPQKRVELIVSEVCKDTKKNSFGRFFLLSAAGKQSQTSCYMMVTAFI